MERDKLQDATNTLFESLRSDEAYRQTWIANIAMSFVDNADWYKKRENKKTLSRKDIWKIANLAADYFLGMLTEVNHWQPAALSDDGWTCCDDRLPEMYEDETEYAITYLDFRDKVTPCFGIGIWADGEWTYDNGSTMLVKVIAWRPLPSPAKGRDV